MIQTFNLEKERLACLELALLPALRKGQACEWVRKYGSAASFLQKAEVLSKAKELPPLRAETRSALLSLSKNWSTESGINLSPRAEQAMGRLGSEMQFVVWGEPDYPAALSQIADAPVCLFYCGQKSILQEVCISIVGSRKANAYGENVAHALACEAAKVGYCVVSGLAKGIDSSAHKGALEVGGKTMAVMPCGLDLCYPRSNTWLYNRIVEEGIAVSEYPPGTMPEKWHFLERNRIVSGLSVVTVVAQAGAGSGSIRTAQFAADQGREVYCVPGSIFEQDNIGAHRLIQDGANILTSIQALTAIYGSPTEVKPVAKSPVMQSEKKIGHAVTYTKRRDSSSAAEPLKTAQNRLKRVQEQLPAAAWLYEAMDDFGLLPEELCRRTGRSAVEVQMALSLLELQGFAEETGQGQVIKI